MWMASRERGTVDSPRERQAPRRPRGRALLHCEPEKDSTMTETNDQPRTIRLRVVNPETPTSDPADVTTIAIAGMEIRGRNAVIGTIRCQTFGAARRCTQADLATAAIWPEPIDVYVTWDLSRTRELIPADATGFASWIGVGRLLVQNGYDLVDRTADAVAIELGLGRELALAPTDGTAASRNAAATALLATLLHRDVGLNQMLWLSSGKTRPLRTVPGLDDAAGWAAMPRDDLDWVRDHQAARAQAGLDPDPAFDDSVTHRATRETNRRRIFVHRS